MKFILPLLFVAYITQAQEFHLTEVVVEDMCNGYSCTKMSKDFVVKIDETTTLISGEQFLINCGKFYKADEYTCRECFPYVYYTTYLPVDTTTKNSYMIVRKGFHMINISYKNDCTLYHFKGFKSLAKKP